MASRSALLLHRQQWVSREVVDPEKVQIKWIIRDYWCLHQEHFYVFYIKLMKNTLDQWIYQLWRHDVMIHYLLRFC